MSKKLKEVRDVASFNPQDYLVQIPSKNNPEVMELYLMVQWRKKWMIEYNPDWAMVTEHQVHEGLGMITATTSIFDENGKLRSTGSASIFLQDTYGKRVETPLELAETRAQGRALGNAGFGTQYALPGGGDEDKEVLAEAPIEMPVLRPRKAAPTPEVSKAKEAPTAPKESDDMTLESILGREESCPEESPKRGRAKKVETLPEEDVVLEMGFTDEPEIREIEVKAEKAEKVAPAPKEAGPKLISTPEEAKGYMITIGMEKGKYMGEVFAINKKALYFYAEGYKGPDENLRRAAKILLGIPV